MQLTTASYVSLLFSLLLMSHFAHSTSGQQLHHEPLHGHPYQDPSPQYGHAPRGETSVIVGDNTAAFFGSDCQSTTCLAGNCPTAVDGSTSGMHDSRVGSRLNCPPQTTAKLTLWIPDNLQVEINGQRTKPQYLAGAHRGSRIYSLERLADAHARPCVIVVNAWDTYGRPTRQRYTLLVQAGGDYQVQYPHGFEPEGHPWHEPQMLPTVPAPLDTHSQPTSPRELDSIEHVDASEAPLSETLEEMPTPAPRRRRSL